MSFIYFDSSLSTFMIGNLLLELIQSLIYAKFYKNTHFDPLLVQKEHAFMNEHHTQAQNTPHFICIIANLCKFQICFWVNLSNTKHSFCQPISTRANNLT